MGEPMTTRLGNNKGIALLTTMVMTFLIVSLCGTYFSVMLTEKRVHLADTNSFQVEGIAEAAVEEVFWEYNYSDGDFQLGEGWSGGLSKTKTVASFTDGGGSTIGGYTVTVDDWNTSNPTVTSVGTLLGVGAGTQATVLAGLRPHPLFANAMCADDQITLSGGGFTDSYDSSLGAYNADLGGGVFNVFQNADVSTNLAAVDAISLDGGATIQGDAATGPGGTVSDPSSVTGMITDDMDEALEFQEIPGALLAAPVGPGGPNLNSDQIINTGIYQYMSINLTGLDLVEIDGSVALYITGPNAITTLGSAELRVRAGSTLVVFVEGNINAGGNGISNFNGTQFPQTFQIYGTPNCTSVSISGTADLVGTVHAPAANVTLGGTSGYYGALVADQITAMGGGGVHYDEQLINGPTDGYELSWWRRTP